MARSLRGGLRIDAADLLSRQPLSVKDLRNQLASLEEEDVEEVCPEVDGTEEKPKEQWDSLQEEDVDWDPLQEEGFEKWCPAVDGTEEKPKEQWDSLQEDVEWDPLQEEDFEKWCPEVDGTEEKQKERLDSLQEGDVERLSSAVDKTEEKPKEQLDSLQEEDVERLCPPEVAKTEEIIKEMRDVKRQNLITHCLVSAMILLTVAWQVSEVSLLLKVKSGLRNPFNFFGGIVKGIILKGARSEGDNEQSSAKQKPVSKPPLIKLPDLHLLDLPIFDSSDGENQAISVATQPTSIQK